ncbi:MULTISPECIES: hypothetical protein [unclassified Spirosoma]|uniref:hypothetical protein n=1 Tax=unclassified Spirosoma TaxID=2621999 RepID=UPI0009698098|nr:MULTISPECIES: hypothetical protein [unclassified Spirosoma]MBN8820660.1 hypothetical protein [Spirosoma sp.]OJW78035.1 MAG: hypothetical protein BGO59_28865 [Spirosoma sp. 48-14]
MTYLVGFNQPAFATHVPPDSLRRVQPQQSISAYVGTTGPGLLYNRVLSQSNRLTLRVGGQYAAYRQTVRLKASSDSYIQINPDITIGLALASLKWHPFQKSSFFITGGVGYTWHPDMRFTLSAENKLDLDGLVMTPEDVGIVTIGFRWHPVVGYLGWGFGRSFPNKRFGAGVEMGVFYLGKPSVNLDYEGFLETTTIDEQVPIVERNLSNYRYLPTLNLTLSYTLINARKRIQLVN